MMLKYVWTLGANKGFTVTNLMWNKTRARQQNISVQPWSVAYRGRDVGSHLMNRCYLPLPPPTVI